MNENDIQRVIAYVDGFNLYFGLRDSNFKRFYWLNIQLLAQNLLKERQQLLLTKYFTARITAPAEWDKSFLSAKLKEKRRRQATFIEALETLQDFRLYYGHYLDNSVECWACGRRWLDPKEKMTDVNIATEMLIDSFENRFDMALLISADSDLVPPIRAIRRIYPSKRFVCAFPPARSSEHLKNAANAFLNIGRGTLAKSQFPDRVRKPDGYVLHKPDSWR